MSVLHPQSDRVTEVTESPHTHTCSITVWLLIHVLVQSLFFLAFTVMYQGSFKEKLPLIIIIYFFLCLLKNLSQIGSNRFRVTSTHSYAARRVWYTSSFLLDLIHIIHFLAGPLQTSPPLCQKVIEWSAKWASCMPNDNHSFWRYLRPSIIRDITS